MSRLILLLILGIWLAAAESAGRPQWAVGPGLWVFLGGYVVLVLGVAIVARVLARQVAAGKLQRGLRQYNRLTHVARWMVPAWLVFGLFGGTGWTQSVLWLAGTELQLTSIVLGTLPALLAWMGLWWAEYPADRAIREQSLLDELAHDLPVHMPPRLWRYCHNMFRQQLLPIVLPVLLIVLLRDVLTLLVGRYIPPVQQDLLMVPAALGVYLASPEILRRVFNARRMDDSPLRRRLEGICARSGLRYRDILLWQTDYAVANAAVIGILPRWRYVLLSDRLLETMSDEQIEAVFAHELGHIVHHHMMWFIVFFVILMLAALGPGQALDNWITDRVPLGWQGEHYENIRNGISAGGVFVVMLVLFGMLARRFEHQADVFAARMMEGEWGQSHEPARGFGHRRYHVGRRGAAVFGSALHRVAVVNNIPLRARDWMHPSIANRLRYLEQLSADPQRTGEFDRGMRRLYAGLLIALAACGAFVALAA